MRPVLTPKVPNTITDEQWADLLHRAEHANTESMFSVRNVVRRFASNRQKRNADKN
jgi:hypothetical protein